MLCTLTSWDGLVWLTVNHSFSLWHTHTQNVHIHTLCNIYRKHLLPKISSYSYLSTIRTSPLDKYLIWSWTAQALFDVGYRDQFDRRFSLYTALSWPEIPQPTLVNTPTDLKTNRAEADQHTGPSRLYSKRTRRPLPRKCTRRLQCLLVLQ